MRLLCSLLLLCTCVAVTAQAAEVYRWVDHDGVVHYADKPPSPGARPAQLPPIQTFHGGTHADPFTNAQPAPAQAAPPTAATAPEIIAPAEGLTERDPNGHLLVRVKASLKPGQGLLYEVDGQTQNPTPTLAMQMDLAGLNRGTHRITVALAGADGRVLARSAPVTVYMKPPIVPANRPPLARPR